MNSLIYQTNLSVPSFLTMKTLIMNLGLTNTAFTEFLMISNLRIGFISNKSIGFLIKFNHAFSEQYHIFELPSLFATFNL